MSKKHSCQICGNPLCCEWTDYHGEGICIICGTPYQLYQYDTENKRIPDALPKITVSEAIIPALKRYWQETHRHMGLGLYMGPVKYPDKLEAFMQWFRQQPEAEYAY